MENQLTLKQLNSLVKETLNNTFPEQLWVVAEIGELKVNRNGHCYIELIEKDNATDEIVARSRATIWSWQFRFIQPYFESTTGQALVAGIKVLVSAKIEFHEVYGISLNITDVDPTFTLGDMARKRKEIIEKLITDGIFDMNKELAMPDIPSRIAIISSETAAGYEDFMTQLTNNNKGYRFYTHLFQATMQGNNAASSIIDALEQIYTYEGFFDLLVIIRGGGSQMDLSCFDNYELAYHVAQFPILVLTGIGHEKDESVTDMVAHTKLKTPTAVAQFIIQQMDIAATEIEELEAVFTETVSDILEQENLRITQAARFFKPLVKASIERANMQLDKVQSSIVPLTKELITSQKNILNNLTLELKGETFSALKNQRNNLHNMLSRTAFSSKLSTSKKLISLNNLNIILKKELNQVFSAQAEKLEWLTKNNNILAPDSVLKRGFSITLKNGKPLKSTNNVSEGDIIETVLHKGKIISEVKNSN